MNRKQFQSKVFDTAEHVLIRQHYISAVEEQELEKVRQKWGGHCKELPIVT